MTKNLSFSLAAATLALGAPAAMAAKPTDAERAARGQAKSQAKAERQAAKCTPKSKGYLAKGTVTAAGLTQTKGAETPADASDDRYSGTVSALIAKGNHQAKADKGTTRTFEFTDVRVKLFDRTGDGVDDQPAAGDRVTVQGKITSLRKRCKSDAFTPVLTVRKVSFKAPKAAEPADAPKAPAAS